jgi:hypothetical protein
MPPRLITFGCSLAGAVGLLALSPAAAQAVSQVKPALSISTPADSYTYGSKVKLTVTLAATAADRTVSVYAKPAGQPRKLVATGKVDAKGKLYDTYRITRTTTFTAELAGGKSAHGKSAAAATAAASRTVTAAALVADTITGSAKTAKIDGLTYRVFPSSGTLTLHASVAPGKKGECLEPETEQFDAGAGWEADAKYGCDRLNSASQDSAPFSLAQAAGDRYRIRADYVRSAKDTANLSAKGPWLYFEVVK